MRVTILWISRRRKFFIQKLLLKPQMVLLTVHTNGSIKWPYSDVAGNLLLCWLARRHFRNCNERSCCEYVTTAVAAPTQYFKSYTLIFSRSAHLLATQQTFTEKYNVYNYNSNILFFFCYVFKFPQMASQVLLFSLIPCFVAWTFDWCAHTSRK